MEEEWEAYKYGTAAANILMTSHVQNLKSSQIETVLDAGLQTSQCISLRIQRISNIFNQQQKQERKEAGNILLMTTLFSLETTHYGEGKSSKMLEESN